jgi:ribokinase
MPEPQPSIVVVGSHAPGIAVRVKRLPAVGETVIGWDLKEPQDGGKGSNQAIAAARLGLAVSFVGCIGNDRLGEECKQTLRAEGVDIQHLYQSNSKETGAGIVIVDENGMPAMITTVGANEMLDFQHVSSALEGFKSAKVLLTQFEIRPEVALHAAQMARRLGMTAVVNPAPAAPISLPDLEVADILVPNEVEAKMLLGFDPNVQTDLEDLVQQLRRRSNAKIVIATVGEQGVVGADSSGVWRALPPKVMVMDTSGAGDVFCAALAVGLTQGLDPRAASVWACSVATLSVTREGTIPSFPTAQEVEKFI